MISNWSLGKKSSNKFHALPGFTCGGRQIFGQKSGKSMGINRDPVAVAGGRSGRIVVGSVKSETTSFEPILDGI